MKNHVFVPYRGFSFLNLNLLIRWLKRRLWFSSPIGAFLFLTVYMVHSCWAVIVPFSSPIGAFLFLTQRHLMSRSRVAVFVPYRGFSFLNAKVKELEEKFAKMFSSPIGAFLFLTDDGIYYTDKWDCSFRPLSGLFFS